MVGLSGGAGTCRAGRRCVGGFVRDCQTQHNADTKLSPASVGLFYGQALRNRLCDGVGGFAFTRIRQAQWDRDLAPLRRGFFVRRAETRTVCAWVYSRAGSRFVSAGPRRRGITFIDRRVQQIAQVRL